MAAEPRSKSHDTDEPIRSENHAGGTKGELGTVKGSLFFWQKSRFDAAQVTAMGLSKDERIQIILMCGSRSARQTAVDFNQAHPDREPITHSCVVKLMSKFQETGSVLDKPHKRKSTVTDRDTSTFILEKVALSPCKSTRQISLETGVSRTSIRRILKKEGWHQYKPQPQQDPPSRNPSAEPYSGYSGQPSQQLDEEFGTGQKHLTAPTD